MRRMMVVMVVVLRIVVRVVVRVIVRVVVIVLVGEEVKESKAIARQERFAKGIAGAAGDALFAAVAQRLQILFLLVRETAAFAGILAVSIFALIACIFLLGLHVVDLTV